MQLQHQKITLDVNDTRTFTVLNAHQGDSKTRFIDITLTEMETLSLYLVTM